MTSTATKQTRIVKKTVPTESFFNFFSPPKAPSEDDDDAASDIEERLELDYQLGEDIKEKLIPRAIDWFTGEALAFEELDEEDFEDDDEEFDEDDDEDDEDRDEDEESDEDDVSLASQPTFGLRSDTDFLLRTTTPSPSRRLPSASRANRIVIRSGCWISHHLDFKVHLLGTLPSDKTAVPSALGLVYGLASRPS